MRTGRSLWFIATLLVFCVTSCENREPFAPITARQTRDPSGAFAKPLNSSSVQVTWTDSLPNETGFRIERGPAATGPWITAGTTSKNISSFQDAGRPSEQQVCYRVITLKQNGVIGTSNTSCTVPPAASSGLTASVLDQQAIELAWTDNSAIETGYEIERALAQSGPYGVIASIAPSTVIYHESGLTTGTTYWYRVRPQKDAGYGDYSNISSATPRFLAPKAPSSLTVDPSSIGWMQLTWGDVNNETGFRIERSLDAGASWSVFQTLGRDTTFAYDTNVPIERQFCYRVFAFNAQGDSPPSTTVCSAIPLAPTDLVAQVVESAIVLTWTDNSALETGYAIARNADDGSSIILLLPANTTTYRDTSALADHVYRYSVEAKSGFGGSGHSNMVTAVIATTPPMTPTSVAVSPVSSSSAEITWTASSNTEGLRIERSGDSGASWATAGTSNGYGDLFDDYELASEQQVCYRVFAFNSHGESAPSSNVCTTPPAAPTDLMATWESDGQTVDLSWTDRSNVEDSYEVWVFNDWESYPIVTLGPNATTYADSYYGIYGYSYVVVALKDGGYSDWSNSASPVAASAPASASLRQGSVLPRPRGSKRP